MHGLTILLAALLLLLAPDAEAARSKAALDAFQHDHPCPSTGWTRPRRERTGRLTRSGKPAYRTIRCPGWVVDHRRALACGGADDPSNMQWQTVLDSRVKDREERRTCRKGG